MLKDIIKAVFAIVSILAIIAIWLALEAGLVVIKGKLLSIGFSL